MNPLVYKQARLFIKWQTEVSQFTGLSSLGVPGVPWHTQILADQLTLFQPGETDYAHLITTSTPGFSDLPTALGYRYVIIFRKPFFSPFLHIQGQIINNTAHTGNHSPKCYRLIIFTKFLLFIIILKDFGSPILPRFVYTEVVSCRISVKILRKRKWSLYENY